MNLFAIRLNLLEHTAENPTIERVLEHIADAVRGVEEALLEMKTRGLSDEHVEALVDDECEFIETLAGTAFVVCQTQITAVVKRARWLHDSMVSTGHTPPTIGSDRQSITGAGGAIVENTDLTEAQIIDACANYFKHSDEWPMDWRKAVGLARRTAHQMTAIGAEPGSTGNLRLGLEALGIREFTQLGRLADLLERWAKQVASTLRQEGVARGML